MERQEIKKKTTPKWKRRTRKGFTLFLIILTLLAIAIAVTLYLLWIRPNPMTAQRLRPPSCTEMRDEAQQRIGYSCPNGALRLWKPLDAISPALVALVTMLEDDKFYAHGGLDVDEIQKSIETDLARKKFARGGSTITQQLAKNLFLTKEKTLQRKLNEAYLALRLEKDLSKKQILELYLNVIEWGPNLYGAEAAAQTYFNHSAAELSTPETWFLALIIPNPKWLNPRLRPTVTKTLLFRARSLARRLEEEHRTSPDESAQQLHAFEEWLTKWVNGSEHLPASPTL